jgi:hypothetical protein
VSPEREPLGVFNAWTWARQFKDADGQRGGLCESVRWIESYERIAESAQQLPATRHVCIGDRESDMLELMVKAHELDYPADYLVRSQYHVCAVRSDSVSHPRRTDPPGSGCVPDDLAAPAARERYCSGISALGLLC